MALPPAFTTVELLVVALTTLTTIGGLFIAYQAYRGLRRNDSRPMWFLSVGLILLFGVTYFLSAFGQFLVSFRILSLPMQDFVFLLVRLLQFSGIVLIAYSMWLAPGKTAGEEEARTVERTVSLDED